MYDFLDFIDSPDIREYNKGREFTPAEEAILISKSMKKTMEEKINTLNQLNFKYSEEEFRKGVFNSNDMTDLSKLSFKDILTDAVGEWERIMGYRKQEDHIIYAARLFEKEHSDYNFGEFVVLCQEKVVLKAILGHSSLAMTMDLHGHVLPDIKAQEMEKMINVF